MNLLEIHWLWNHFKQARSHTFGTGTNKFYDSDFLKGYIESGYPIGLWSLYNTQDGSIIEQTIFIR